jgi:hypothetical protein
MPRTLREILGDEEYDKMVAETNGACYFGIRMADMSTDDLKATFAHRLKAEREQYFKRDAMLQAEQQREYRRSKRGFFERLFGGD